MIDFALSKLSPLRRGKTGERRRLKK